MVKIFLYVGRFIPVNIPIYFNIKNKAMCPLSSLTSFIANLNSQLNSRAKEESQA
jgi:hypothetical protein